MTTLLLAGVLILIWSAGIRPRRGRSLEVGPVGPMRQFSQHARRKIGGQD